VENEQGKRKKWKKKMRDKILDAAEELFLAKGFDKTSTNDIMKKAGIVRGTLYNHFRSKEDVLDGMTSRMVGRMLEKASEVVKDKDVPVLTRMTEIILALNVDTEFENEVMRQIHRPQNALLHQKIQNQILAGIVPILNHLLEEGKEEGIFHTKYGTEAIEMIMLYANVMFDDMTEQSQEQREQRMQGFIYNAERLLGTKEGELQTAIMRIFERNVIP